MEAGSTKIRLRHFSLYIYSVTFLALNTITITLTAVQENGFIYLVKTLN
jgi:hypothetical protein